MKVSNCTQVSVSFANANPLSCLCLVPLGDMVPRTYAGMLVGALCALAGVLTIGK